MADKVNQRGYKRCTRSVESQLKKSETEKQKEPGLCFYIQEGVWVDIILLRSIAQNRVKNRVRSWRRTVAALIRWLSAVAALIRWLSTVAALIRWQSTAPLGVIRTKSSQKTPILKV
ncbi:hypothetical protein Bpfe_016470, partial [Biomphalaria pfeifferi]